MTKPMVYAKRTLIGLTVFLQIAFYPAIALAETDPATGTGSTTLAAPIVDPTPPPAPPLAPIPEVTAPNTAVNPPATPVTGPSQPSGPDSSTYHINPDGTWSNSQYTWDPVTHKTTPNTPQDYSFNPATNAWDTTEYRYDAPSGKYVPNIVSTPQNPNSKLTTQSTPSLKTPGNTSANDPSFTGPNSTNLANSTSNNNGFFSGFFNAKITNSINTTSHSGNAGVVQNTIGGNALSGNADAMANLLTMLQSSWDPNNGGPQTFVANINGDVDGDLTIDPSLISTTGPGSLNATNSTKNNNLRVVAQQSGQIDNKINLDASSGNANLSGNTSAGDAKSGNANAVANLINLINSSISAGHSFVGVLNINGNLNGDVLLAPWLLKALLADTGPNSTNTANQSVNNNLNATVSDNQTINNNVSADAQSGSAGVAGNTSAGSANTGKATTNVTLLNLTGKQVIAKDALLVFVNVFGKWVGLIMHAPAGSTSALIGGTGPGSTNTTNSTTNNNAMLNSTSNELINNDVKIKAKSGDANVSGNTTAGDATSGDANAGVNVANFINSKLNLSDWFGVLFINVFGNWNGSFGIDTPFGNPVASNANTSTTINTPASPTGSNNTSPAQAAANVFGFNPRRTGSTSSNNNSTNGQVEAATTSSHSQVSEGKKSPTTSAAASSVQPALTPQAHANWTWTIAGVSTAISLLGLERFLSLRRRI